MKKVVIYFFIVCGVSLTSCSDFMNITPQDSITPNAVFSSLSSTRLFINDVYACLNGPLYDWTAIGKTYNKSMFDNAFTDDMVNNDNAWNQFNFTASSAPFERWTACYKAIRKANEGIENLKESEVLTQEEKERFLGDLYFLRGMFYFELFRFYGKLPIIEQVLNKEEDEIFLPRSSEEEVVEFILNDFQLAADYLPKDITDTELGRATKGAAIGMKALVYLHAAGVLDATYYEDAYKTADILINGELKGKYDLFRIGNSPEEIFHNLFLEEYEYNQEVIFDIQFAYPYKASALQTLASPPKHGIDDYGWGNRDNPTQEIVDAFEMKDGTEFSWNNPVHAANPYDNRDARFYASILYNGAFWKGDVLYTSTNIWSDVEQRFVINSPNGFASASNSTFTGYYLKKHMNESVIAGYSNRGLGVGGGHNLIVLRYAEILLVYAEAKNEVLPAPDQSVYDAVNTVRQRAGQPVLPSGLSQIEMRERIRRERRIELAFENKRYFDIVRWREGNKYLNQQCHGMKISYSKVNGEIVPKYERVNLVKKVFDENKNYLLPVPQSAINKNPKLYPNNPGW
mgnify:CR=1 FL=1